MIKDLFLPEKIGAYYVFVKRVISFQITKSDVYATLVYFQGNTITIEKYFHQSIVTATQDEYLEKTSAAIASIMNQVPKSAVVYVAMPSSVALFKELKLPFVGREKIGMVVDYEIEPLLPFALTDAVVDFIITKENKEEKSSQALVVAVQNQYIAQMLAIFESIHASPQLITIDMLALYSLYKAIAHYAEKKGSVVLLQMEWEATSIAYLYDGQLHAIRTLPRGMHQVVRQLSEKLTIDASAVIDYLLRTGLEHSDYERNKLYRSVLQQFFSELSLTLQSFTSQMQNLGTINTIILSGPYAGISGICEVISDALHTLCSPFNISEVLHHLGIHYKNKNNHFPPSQTIALASALQLPLLEHFNLRKKEFAAPAGRFFLKNIIIASCLTLMLLCGLIISSAIKISHLKAAAQESEMEVVDALKDRFKSISDDATNLEDVVDEAQKAVNQEEKIWFAFSGAGRPGVLRYLFELTSLIDKENLGLILDRILITEDAIVLRGEVRTINELKRFEADLRQSKLFSYVEPQQDKKFSSMTIRLNKNITG